MCLVGARNVMVSHVFFVVNRCVCVCVCKYKYVTRVTLTPHISNSTNITAKLQKPNISNISNTRMQQDRNDPNSGHVTC